MAYDDIREEVEVCTKFLRILKKDISSGQARNYLNVSNGLKRLGRTVRSLENILDKQDDKIIRRRSDYVKTLAKELQDIVSHSIDKPASWIKVTNRLDDLIPELDGLSEVLAAAPQGKAGQAETEIPTLGRCKTADELASAIGYMLDQGGAYTEKVNVTTGDREWVPDPLGTKGLLGLALRNYNELLESGAQLPPLKIDSPEPLAALAQIQQLCMGSRRKKASQEIVRLAEEIIGEAKDWLAKPQGPYPFSDLSIMSDTIYCGTTIDRQSATTALSRIKGLRMLLCAQGYDGLAQEIEQTVRSIRGKLAQVNRLVASGRRREQCLTPLKQAVQNLIETLKNVVEITRQGKGGQVGKKAKSSKSRSNRGDLKKRFRFTKAQAFFDKKDLQLPTGAEVNPSEVLKKLAKSFGKVVPYKDLDENSSNTASDFLRGKIRTINLALREKKVPATIKAKKWTGYVLSTSRTHS